jgi:hypothetical protein
MNEVEYEVLLILYVSENAGHRLLKLLMVMPLGYGHASL